MNDDTLLLHYYNDGLEDDERRALERALHRDPLLKARYDKLVRELEGLPAPAAVRTPHDFAARLHDSIDREARLETQRQTAPRPVFHFASFIWGTAITAVLVAGIGIGYFLGRAPAVDAPLAQQPLLVDTTPPADGSAAFTRGLQVHFRQSRDELGMLPGYSSDQRALLVREIVQQNRLYARAATENNAPELARVLRAFEPVLTRLAAEDLSPQEAARLQAKLAFELNVMLTKLGSAPSNSSESI